jgi:hypothetical protein
MERLKILTAGSSSKTQVKLFNAMVTEVLSHFGYSIDRVLNINHSGMEIDIEGKQKKTGTPFYAECKYYEKDVPVKEFQAFFGTYMTKWHKDKQCHGLFIALPGVDSPSKEFYREHIEGNKEVKAQLFEEKEVLKAISSTHGIISPKNVAMRIVRDMGKLGDCLLFYTEKGIFWVQYIISPGKRVPDRVAFFSDKGVPLSDKSILNYLVKLSPELIDFENICVGDTVVFQQGLFQDEEEIVEVKGSSEFFQYQFPASPEHFFGRKPLLTELDSFVTEVLNKETPSRSILLEAPSGWGKSSMILASVAHLREMGHCAVAIDSRSASSPQFIKRLLSYAIRRLEDLDDIVIDGDHANSITRYDNAVRTILDIGKTLESYGKLMFIFLDQFENIFFLPDVLSRVRDLFLQVKEAKTNLVLCFSWRTDVIDLNDEFPRELHDIISNSSKHIALNTFTAVETNALFDRLSVELNETLTKDFKFFLSEFSFGYPWLLKKLCAYVKSQKQAGMEQLDIAKNYMNVEEIFREDLQGLSDDEKASLSYIAKTAPVRISESSKIFEPQVVQSLINRELVVRIGSTCDIYSDTFRDYLNTDISPALESYIFQTQVGNVLKAVKILTEANGSIDTIKFKERTGYLEKPFFRIVRDMVLLGLAKIINGKVVLRKKLSKSSKEKEVSLRNHLKNSLRGNRLVRLLLKTLEEKNNLTIDEVSKVLDASSPYISHTKKTWLSHARTYAKWMDASDLAVLDSKNKMLIRFDPDTELRERHLLLPKRRGAQTPWIQYSHVEKIAARLVQALQGNGNVDWTGLSKNTVFRALAALEDLGFIIRNAPLIRVLPKGQEFVLNPNKRALLFAEGALQIDAFSIFLKTLKAHKTKGNTLLKLGLEVREKLGVDWKRSTAEAVAQIMLDWARHADLAPGVFAKTRRGPIKGWKKKNDGQMALFSDIL